MQIFRYRLLRYMPDPELAKEVVNIGLIAEIEGKLQERHLKNWEKVWAIDDNADISRIESAIEFIFNALKKMGSLEGQSAQTFKQKVRISGIEEIEIPEGKDPVLTMEMIHARLVEGRKDEIPQIEGATLEEASRLIKSPERRKQVEEGRISEARMAVEKLDRKTITNEEYLTLLIFSDNETDWVTAWNEVRETGIKEPRLFISLAYKFWFAGNVEFAIRVAEEGLERIEPDNEKYILRFKNNLAYFYADLRKPEDEEKARDYIQEARKGCSDANAIDTEGYVLISYGKSEKEILEGVKLCEEARQKGIEFKLYHRHVTRAYERLKELGAA